MGEKQLSSEGLVLNYVTLTLHTLGKIKLLLRFINEKTFHV